MENDQSVWTQSTDGQKIEVPPQGSLGLLAAGYKGIMLWRTARQKAGDSPIARAKAIAAAMAAAKKEKETDVNSDSP